MTNNINQKGFRGYDPQGKKAAKEQAANQKDFEKRRDELLKEVQALSAKYKIDIRGALQYTQGGIIPMVAFVDIKGKMEHTTEEAKKANEKETKAVKTNLEL